MARNTDLPATPTTALEPYESEDLAERRAYAWLQCTQGYTQTAVAEALGVSRQTIHKYINAEAEIRVSRLENSEAELEKLIGQIEAIASRAWSAHRGAPSNSLAGSNYLRLVLDAAREIARLRGFDALVARRGDSSPTRAQVVVRIGGTKDFENAITIGAQVVGGELAIGGGEA